MKPGIHSYAFDMVEKGYPYRQVIKRQLKTETPHTKESITRTTIVDWLKKNGIRTHKTFGVAGDVLIDHNWKVFCFRNQDHAMAFRLSWPDLFN